MQAEEELARYAPDKDTILTIGVFDGVHLGHKYLISQLKARAKELKLLSGVVTFYPHPQEVLQPHVRIPWLTNITQRTRLLKNEGVDIVVPLTFTWELGQLDARQFVNLLMEYLRMRALFLGPDSTLGRKREGNIEVLRRLGKEMGFSVDVVTPYTSNSDVVSSTAVRKALAAGDVKKFLRFTGRLFSLEGIVIAGTGRGHELGFPTANLDTDPNQALPADGVYATRAFLNGKSYPSATNIGTNPTFGKNKRTVEVFVFDYNHNLYAQHLKVEFTERLRGEKKFGSIEELKIQIAEDVRKAREVLRLGVEAKNG